jgi:hypothetical protein
MADRLPRAEESLVDGPKPTTPWATADERLANPEKERTYWLATVRPDGRPHVMPIIALWMDGRLYFLAGEGTRKGKNLALESRCVIAGSSTKLPSLDIILEGDTRKVADETTVRRVVEAFGSKLEWPHLEVEDGGVVGPNAPTAGPPPYALYELTPATVFGLPGTAGMEKTGDAGLGPTRWRF